MMNVDMFGEELSTGDVENAVDYTVDAVDTSPAIHHPRG